jgi:hypothetical protein
MRDNLERYWAPKARRRLLWLDERWVHFGVTTLARILYTLETGELASKPEAVAWLRPRLPEVDALLDRRGRLSRAVAARRFVRARIDEGRRRLDAQRGDSPS